MAKLQKRSALPEAKLSAFNPRLPRGSCRLLDKHIEKLEKKKKIKFQGDAFIRYRIAVLQLARMTRHSVLLFRQHREALQKAEGLAAKVAHDIGKISDVIRSQNSRVKGAIERFPLQFAPLELSSMTIGPIYDRDLKALSRCKKDMAALAEEFAEEARQSTRGPRTDLEANFFVGGMRDIYGQLTGEWPSASARGPFVEMTEDAWRAAGWPERSFSKIIVRLAKQENWPRLRGLPSHINGG